MERQIGFEIVLVGRPHYVQKFIQVGAGLISGNARMVVEAYLERFRRASLPQKGIMLRERKEEQPQAPHLAKKERKGLKKVYRKELVKRSALMRIAAAWVITVPFSGLLAAILFFTIRGMMLP